MLTEGMRIQPMDDCFNALDALADQIAVIERTTASPSAEIVRHSQQSSVEINQTSTGKFGVTVKVYDDDPEQARLRAIEELRKARRDIALIESDGGVS